MKVKDAIISNRDGKIVSCGIDTTHTTQADKHNALARCKT